MRPLKSVLCLLSSVLCLCTTAQVKDTTVAPPPEPVKPIAEVINPALTTLWVASDSTAANGGPTATGWGVPLPDYFDLAKINVVNRARGGRSSRTFITEGLWDKLLEGVKAGDFVLIQFGHNDAGALNEEPPGSGRPLRARGSIPSLGDETQEIDNVLTKKHEVVHTYGWYMRKMLADVKTKNATPIILSLTVRNEWKDGKVERYNGPWRKFSHDIAQTAGIAYIDLTRLIADEYQKLGAAKVNAFFPKDHTHTGAEGADLNASLVVAGLKGIRKGPFAAFLSAKGAAVESDRIGWLNLPEPADPKLPSIVLIGDSTVRNGRGDGEGGQWGWGDYLGRFFDPAKVNIVNRAIGGLSSRTFLTQGHWDRALTLIKPGDFVLMQFGHNDGGAINDTSRARATIKGTGEETEEIDNLLTKQHEVVHSYGWYLRKYIRDAKAAGATPIVCSLVPRKTWVDGGIARATDSYAGWARQVAGQEGAGFVDLNELIARTYDRIGPALVEPLFADKNTHTSESGAILNAKIVVEGLRGLSGVPVDGFLSEDGREMRAAK
jgi:lysophospholipase L1-like esterase